MEERLERIEKALQYQEKLMESMFDILDSMNCKRNSTTALNESIDMVRGMFSDGPAGDVVESVLKNMKG
jgi:hypothetical protein